MDAPCSLVRRVEGGMWGVAIFIMHRSIAAVLIMSLLARCPHFYTQMLLIAGGGRGGEGREGSHQYFWCHGERYLQRFGCPRGMNHNLWISVAMEGSLSWHACSLPGYMYTIKSVPLMIQLHTQDAHTINCSLWHLARHGSLQQKSMQNQ